MAPSGPSRLAAMAQTRPQVPRAIAFRIWRPLILRSHLVHDESQCKFIRESAWISQGRHFRSRSVPLLVARGVPRRPPTGRAETAPAKLLTPFGSPDHLRPNLPMEP